ncbi:MAG: peptidoglycan-binding protein LysM [Saprospiraceae bacterium]
MGLFSFLKEAGQKLFGHKTAAPTASTPSTDAPSNTAETENQNRVAALIRAIQPLGIVVENLSIDYADHQVTVNGQVETQEQREKIILTLGNVIGVAVVDDRLSVTNPAPEATFYEVKSGDSLSKIAKAQYGDAMKYPLIFEANKPMLSDPDLIYPGQMLRIPQL